MQVQKGSQAGEVADLASKLDGLDVKAPHHATNGIVPGDMPAEPPLTEAPLVADPQTEQRQPVAI